MNYHKEDQPLAEPVLAHVSNLDYESDALDGMDDTVDLEPDIIPQVDGHGDVLVLDYELPPSINQHLNVSGSNVRTAPYTLNQSKQTAKITEDASINDFEVNVNNNDQNATVKCSSGFYIQVARASIGSLNNGTMFSAGDIVITVDNITITKDLSGLEATKLISFSLRNRLETAGYNTL